MNQIAYLVTRFVWLTMVGFGQVGGDLDQGPTVPLRPDNVTTAVAMVVPMAADAPAQDTEAATVGQFKQWLAVQGIGQASWQSGIGEQDRSDTKINMIRDWLSDKGFGQTCSGWIIIAGAILAVVFLSLLADVVAKRLLLVGLKSVIHRTDTSWDDILLEKKVFDRLAHIAPALVVFYAAKHGLAESSVLALLITRVAGAYMVVVGMLVLDSLLSAVVDIYRTFEVSLHRPIKGYVQVGKILIYCIAAVSVLCILLGKHPGFFFGGLGAFTAVLMLVFKDSILGFVAGIQLTRNDMVRRGDWIEMPKYGADGDVIDISLNTIKVQNWDKTVTSIPAYALISDSFKNWRGMSESGGRRIKRAMYIDTNSIKFCSDQMLDRFEKFGFIKEYIRQKRKEVAQYNSEQKLDDSVLVNGRRLTNIGTFRAYVEAYLRNHPKIHNNMTFLIRQLPPTEHGLPLEIYVFSNDQEWSNYEAIQSGIFDHLLAVVPQFELRVFQNPTGSDFTNFAKVVK